ncbi:MAG: aminoacyl-tRNA hydrolase, partial [Candidatus Vogelbacteria bacterium CG22_combo_CG10-13_8_21_14_all_37_9]
MNKSGVSIKDKIKNPKQAEKLIVVHDDLDLPLGTIKISFNRGSGGHKGLESLIRVVKT